MEGRSSSLSRNSFGGVGVLSVLSLATLLCGVFFTEIAQGKVLCYVCSWQSPAHGGRNMTDTCSHFNFDEVYTTAIECDFGCEAVSIRKSKNEDVINFYKNCKSKSSSKDGCSTTDDNMHHTTTCECSSDLCNGVENSHNVQIKGGCFLFSFLTLLLW